jgi:hypothetical protein
MPAHTAPGCVITVDEPRGQILDGWAHPKPPAVHPPRPMRTMSCAAAPRSHVHRQGHETAPSGSFRPASTGSPSARSSPAQKCSPTPCSTPRSASRASADWHNWSSAIKVGPVRAVHSGRPPNAQGPVAQPRARHCVQHVGVEYLPVQPQRQRGRDRARVDDQRGDADPRCWRSSPSASHRGNAGMS